MAATKNKTKCQVCGALLWNWHVKRHMIQHHFDGTNHDKHYRTRFEHNSEENLSSSADYNGEMSEPGMTSNEEDNSDDDICSAEEGMFEDERALSVETYTNGLSDYNPKRVLKYLNWTTREITPREKEVLQVLRSISFGGGLSAAHTKEMLDYARGLGGIHTSITTRCTRMMYVHYDVH